MATMDVRKERLYSRPMADICKTLKILKIVQERQRGLPPNVGVLPRTVQVFLDEYRAEQTLREDMVELWRDGFLERIGGTGARRGYRVAV